MQLESAGSSSMPSSTRAVGTRFRSCSPSRTEHYIRGRGYAKSPADLEKVVLGSENGTPITVRDVARVRVGPAQRRGLADLDGKGETVGAVVIMRHGENALNVIDAVKARLAEVKVTLPE